MWYKNSNAVWLEYVVNGGEMGDEAQKEDTNQSCGACVLWDLFCISWWRRDFEGFFFFLSKKGAGSDSYFRRSFWKSSSSSYLLNACFKYIIKSYCEWNTIIMHTLKINELRNLSKVTQLLSGKAEIQTRAVWTKLSHSYPLHLTASEYILV